VDQLTGTRSGGRAVILGTEECGGRQNSSDDDYDQQDDQGDPVQAAAWRPPFGNAMGTDPNRVVDAADPAHGLSVGLEIPESGVSPPGEPHPPAVLRTAVTLPASTPGNSGLTRLRSRLP